MEFIAMRYSNMTWSLDHMGYIPILGLIGLVVAALGQIMGRLTPFLCPLGFGIVSVIMALLALESHSYAKVFVSQKSLWTYTVAHNPKDCVAHNNLGNALLDTNRVPDAIEQFKQSLEIDPKYANAHLNLGVALQQQGQTAEAVEQYKLASKINPNLAEAYSNFGDILLQSGQFSEAIEQYKLALKANPNLLSAHGNMGLALYKMGRIPEASEQYQEVLRINPDDPLAKDNLEQLQALQKTAPAEK